MYLSHFGLNQSPFGITPNPAFFYDGSSRGAILDALIYAVMHGEGIIKVTGEVGSGKTMLCRMLESMLPPNIEVIYLVNPTLNRDEVIYAIAGELDLATGGKRADEVIRLLQNDLIAKHVAGKQVVLLIEEAQAMPLNTLEEIRLFSNLETAHHKLLQIVLFGQPELDESLSLPGMRQLKERITHSFKVPPLPLKVIPEFLMFRMRAAGYHGPDIFSRGAIRLIGKVSEGIVRRISILADKSLLAAFADDTHFIQPKHVRQAIRDSEFSNTATAARHRKIMVVLSLLMLTGLILFFAIGWKNFRPAIIGLQPAAPIVATAVAPLGISKPEAALSKDKITPTASAQIENKTPSSIDEIKLPKLSGPLPSDTIQQRLNATKAWLSTEAQEYYTVQLTLIAVGDRPQLEQFLQKTRDQIGIEQVHIYPTRISAVPRFGIVYGYYATRADALTALTDLSKKWGYRPQLRTIRGIREEIERSRSNDLWS
ncbi:MAG: AAA family ATPase [Glaciimonas sp.]|nr:AAA family ATPase [Glaciimonas sp.]